MGRQRSIRQQWQCEQCERGTRQGPQRADRASGGPKRTVQQATRQRGWRARHRGRATQRQVKQRNRWTGSAMDGHCSALHVSVLCTSRCCGHAGCAESIRVACALVMCLCRCWRVLPWRCCLGGRQQGAGDGARAGWRWQRLAPCDDTGRNPVLAADLFACCVAVSCSFVAVCPVSRESVYVYEGMGTQAYSPLQALCASLLGPRCRTGFQQSSAYPFQRLESPKDARKARKRKICHTVPGRNVVTLSPHVSPDLRPAKAHSTRGLDLRPTTTSRNGRHRYQELRWSEDRGHPWRTRESSTANTDPAKQLTE